MMVQDVCHCTFMDFNHLYLTEIVLRNIWFQHEPFPVLKLHILGTNQGVNALKNKYFKRNEGSRCLSLHSYGLESFEFDSHSTEKHLVQT